METAGLSLNNSNNSAKVFLSHGIQHFSFFHKADNVSGKLRQDPEDVDPEPLSLLTCSFGRPAGCRTPGVGWGAGSSGQSGNVPCPPHSPPSFTPLPPLSLLCGCHSCPMNSSRRGFPAPSAAPRFLLRAWVEAAPRDRLWVALVPGRKGAEGPENRGSRRVRAWEGTAGLL